MSVVEAVEADLAEIRKRDKKLADSALAASALVLAEQLDTHGSATSKALCARALREAMDRLRELAPPQRETDSIDDLAEKRRKRRAAAGRSRTSDKARS